MDSSIYFSEGPSAPRMRWLPAMSGRLWPSRNSLRQRRWSPNDRRNLEPHGRTNLRGYEPARRGYCPGLRYLLALCPDDLERCADHARRPAHHQQRNQHRGQHYRPVFGIFIIVAGGLADQFGRVKLTNIGLAGLLRLNVRTFEAEVRTRVL